MQLGPVRFAVDVKSQSARRPFDHKLFVRETRFSLNGMPDGPGIHDLYAALAADQRRNDFIFDDARLDTLFLALPVSWKGTLIQYTGRLHRLHRLHPGKTEVRIYDYVDRAVPMLMKMFEKRLRGYRAIGYARD